MTVAGTLTCALSGQSPPLDPVVTPSGRICSRRLLLTKLSENGGRDPFETSRTLDESDLVDLKLGGGTADVVPPRLPSASSLPSLLSQIQNEHDAILLELYDTRRALEETRRELSQALYQNDAAVRVVARLAQERDAARERVRELSSRPSPPPQKPGVEDDKPAVVAEDGDGRKRRRVEGEGGGPAVVEPEPTVAAAAAPSGPPDRIPPEDLSVMVNAWKSLSKGRRKAAKEKKGAGDASGLKPEDFSKFAETQKVSLHKSSSKPGILCLAGSAKGNIVISGGRDRQAVVYDAKAGRALATLSGSGGEVTAVDVSSDGAVVITGSSNSAVRLYGGSDYASRGSVAIGGGGDGENNDTIVSVSVQPTGKYAIAATKSGRIAFLSLSEGDDMAMAIRAAWTDDGLEKDVMLTCGGLHPDGLIYCVGTSDGKLRVWDLKGHALAGVLECEGGFPVSHLSFSENGYHFASSSADGTVRVWDLRKLKCIATLGKTEVKAEDGGGGAAVAARFDPSSKFLAYGHPNGSVSVVPVKEWNSAIAIGGGEEGRGAVSDVLWGPEGTSLVTCCGTERPVRFWGVAAVPKEEETGQGVGDGKTEGGTDEK